MSTTTTSRLLLGVASAGIAAMLLSGCSLIQSITGGGDATRDETGQVVEGNDSADVFSMRVGDCLNDSSAGSEVSSVPIVPCSEPHDSEIYAELELAEGDFPGDITIQEQADEHCLAEFEKFVGINYNDSTLELSYYSPTAGSWTQMNDRLVSCIVYDPEGQTTGSLEGAAR